MRGRKGRSERDERRGKRERGKGGGKEREMKRGGIDRDKKEWGTRERRGRVKKRGWEIREKGEGKGEVRARVERREGRRSERRGKGERMKGVARDSKSVVGGQRERRV